MDQGFPDENPFGYQYYDNGNISDISYWAGEESYTYDANGRLTQWNFTPTAGSPVQENYQYDQAGNLTVKGSNYYTYNQANRITNYGYSYDDNGNLTSDGTYNYTYNSENQLTAVRQASNNNLVATYSYYYNGLRRSKTVGGVTTYFHWDAFGNLASQNDTSGNSLDFYYDPSGNIIGFVRNGDPSQKYIYHTNLRGDIVTVTDSTNTIQAQYSYDPWGTQTSYSGTITQPLRYAGYYYDDETGLYYLKSRYYSPETGRFITKDGYGYVRYGDSMTLNLYVYCGDNPISKVDRNGNSDEFVDISVVSDSGETILVDSNEYNYLCNLSVSDPDQGNRIWAQSILDKYNAALSEKNSNGYLSIGLKTPVCTGGSLIIDLDNAELGVSMSGGAIADWTINWTPGNPESGFSTFAEQYIGVGVTANSNGSNSIGVGFGGGFGGNYTVMYSDIKRAVLK